MKTYRTHLVFLLLFLLYSPLSAIAQICDIDADSDIDRNDINLILAARNMPASGPDDPKDANGDGMISVNDARICTLQCTLSRCAIIDPPVELPLIDVSPALVDFGDVFIGSSVNQSLIVNNTGSAALSVSSIASSGQPFRVFPPLSFDIGQSDLPRNVEIGFHPTVSGDFSGTITFNSNADNEDPVLVAVRGRGIEPGPSQEPDIDVSDSMDFGALVETQVVEQLLTIRNVGDAPLNVSDVFSDNSAFVVLPLTVNTIPFTLAPGASQNVSVVFTAPFASAGLTIAGKLTISSNDPDQPTRDVSVVANVIAPFVALVNNPILGASVDDVISNSNCSNVSGGVQFGVSNGVKKFNVTLRDQGGVLVSSSDFYSNAAGGNVAFDGINACSLDDGVLKLSILLEGLEPFIGSPAIKHTSMFPAPVLDPVSPVSVLSTLKVCGTSLENTTVKIAGGSRIVSISLDATTQRFCLDVPLRINTQNTLIATAIDNLAAAPRPTASAQPVQVVHVDPASIIIAQASSRPLTIEETEFLVANGIINLDNPSNFNVSMFTIVLTIGSFPVTISQPVAVPTTPGISYGGGGGSGGGGGGWVTAGGGAPRPVTGCVTGCSNIVVIQTPTGQIIPGVIIIDGRIKTLKEFFQVTIAIQNTSTGFVLSDMLAEILLPAGLSPVRSGPGTNVADVNTSGEIDKVLIGDIGPMDTGTGQFIIRGDGIGTHNVDVDFSGFISGGGLPAPFPVNGSAGTSVQVYGPPTLDVVVRHPSNIGTDDVVAGVPYDLFVEITNTSPRPALYTSLELFVGGDAQLVDAAGSPIPDSNEIRSFGHIPSGRTVSAAFRINPLVTGEIIACQAIASENISLTVDTGPDGTVCNIANTYPANFEPLPADQPPVVIGINPLNGQPNIPVTSSVLATLTPVSGCIVGDTFSNVVEALIDLNDPSKGIQVISWSLLQAGTFYLEELDTFGNPVRHIPTDLTVEYPPAGGTTIAVLRLGLDSPHNNSQYFLRANTMYRVTLKGGIGGICSDASGAEMEESVTWSFSTEQTCSGITGPLVTMIDPVNGSIDRPLNQSIVLNFTNRMDPASFAFVPFDLSNSTFSVYADAAEAGGEISGGTPVAGSGVFSNLNRTLTYAPLSNFGEDIPVHVRLTDGLRDVCGNPLQTSPGGVQLLSFQTAPPDILAPVAPVVNPLALFTNSPSVQVSGESEAASTVTVGGGAVVKSTIASAAGRFSVSVPLVLNGTSNISVQASDASGNVSPLVIVDANGQPLVVSNDSVRPLVSSTSPASGAVNVERNTVIQVNFNEKIKPGTINNLNFVLDGSIIPGTLAAVGDSAFSFTPDNLLGFNKTYTIRSRANGVRDLAGNGLASDSIAMFTTKNYPLPALSSVVPNTGKQGTTFSVVFEGSELASTSAIISDNPGVTGSVISATDTEVNAEITVDALAATGPTTLGLTTLGGSTSLSFTVLHKAPVISTLTPNSGAQGATITAQIQGNGLSDISSITIDGTGVTVTDLGTGNDALLNVQFVIDAAATPVGRNVSVTTPGGSDNVVFTVVEHIPSIPVLTSVTPNKGEQGTSFEVIFNGSNLAAVTAISSLNTGVTASIVSSSDTSLVANITISASATLGVTSLSVLAPDGASNALTFTVNNASDRITLTPASVLLQTIDSVSVNVAINTIADAGGKVIALSSSNAAVATVPASVTIPQGANSASFILTVGTATGTSTIVASAAGLMSDSSLITVNARTMSFSLLSPFIGAGRSANASVILTQPAPSGGVTVNLSTGNTAVATVSPANIFIPAGTTSHTFDINGVAIGTTPLTASASGFTNVLDNIIVTSSNVVNFGLIPDVAPGQSVSLPTSLGQPAPAGGLTINFISSNPAIATVTASVFIPEGLQVPAANPQINGVLIGSVQITGIATGYAPDVRVANVTLDANFTPASLSVAMSASKNITLQISAPAPVGGLAFSLSMDNPAIATVPTAVTVGVGQTSAQVLVTAVSVGATTLRANAPGIDEASASINVDPQPSINIGNTSVGDDLQIALSGSLGAAAPAGHVQLTLTSSEPSKILLSSSRTSVGSGSITVQINAGSASIPAFYVQSLTDSGTVTITASAPGYATNTSTVTSTPSGFWLNSNDFSRDVFAANTTIELRSARLNPGTLTRTGDQELRAGLSVSVDLTNSDPGVGTLTVNPVVFNGGVSVAVNTAFDTLGAGATTITLVQPAGFAVPANVNSSIVATVTAPNIALANVTVGKNLQTSASISLSNAPPNPVDVTVTIADSSVALISKNRTSAGSNSVTFSGVSGTSVGTIYVQGIVIGATQITVQAPAYNDDAASVTVDPSGFWLNASDFTRDVFAANTNIQLRSTRLTPSTLNRAGDQELRAGLSVSVALTNSDSGVGTLTVNPVVFNGGVSVAANTAFDTLGAGATTIALVQPAGFAVPANVNSSIVATVTAPNISLGNVLVGKDLQTSASISLSNAPPSPVDVTVTIAESSVALISTSRTSAGSNTVTFSGVSGTSVGTIYVQGIAIGSTLITVQAAAYNDETASVTIDPSGFWLNASDFTRDVFAANTNIQLRSTRLTPSTLNRAGDQELRAGLSVSVALTNSDSGVGTLTVNPVVFNGGVSVAATTAFDTVSAGATTIALVQPAGFSVPANVNSSIVATVTAPNISLANVTVGKDLQTSASISLSNAPPSPVDVTVTIAAGSVALISKSRTSAGGNSVTFSGVSGTSVGTIYVQGIAIGSTQITVQAPAYNDDTASVTVDPSGFWLNASDFTRDVSAANTNIQLRSSYLNPTTLNRAADQELRAGLSVSVNLINSEPSVGALTVNPVVFSGGVSVAANTAFAPLSAGATAITLLQPAGFAVPANMNSSIVATVTAP